MRFIGGSAAARAKAKEQAGWWTAVANLKEAAACLWIAANELALPVERPDEVGL